MPWDLQFSSPRLQPHLILFCPDPGLSLEPWEASQSHSGRLPLDVPGHCWLTLSQTDLGIFPQTCSSSSSYQGWRHHPPVIGTQKPRTGSLMLPPPAPPAHHILWHLLLNSLTYVPFSPSLYPFPGPGIPPASHLASLCKFSQVPGPGLTLLLP